MATVLQGRRGRLVVRLLALTCGLVDPACTCGRPMAMWKDQRGALEASTGDLTELLDQILSSRLTRLAVWDTTVPSGQVHSKVSDLNRDAL